MNFLGHLVLAGSDENLRLGAMLGDFVRGRAALEAFPPRVRTGILLHRRIDAFTDSLAEIVALRTWFPADFRRYAGIVIDLGFDCLLAQDWDARGLPQTLEEHDTAVRQMLARQDELIPPELRRFMDYADRRGLFAAYRAKPEVLHSLRGVGKRLSRPNPLHRADEIWDPFEVRLRACFDTVFSEVEADVSRWLGLQSSRDGC